MMKRVLGRLYNYLLWIPILLVFFSCSRNITPVDTAKKHSEIPATRTASVDSLAGTELGRAGNYIAFDTLVHPIHSGVPAPWKKDAVLNARVEKKVMEYYARNGYTTRWLGEKGAGYFFDELKSILAHADLVGLTPADYSIERIEEKLQEVYKTQPAIAAEVVDLDVQLTEVFFLFTTHVQTGRIRNIAGGGSIWIRDAQEEKTADIALLAGVDKPEQLATALAALQPASEQYAKLQKALESYRTMEKSEAAELPMSLAINNKIKPADRHAVIPYVRRKLSLTDLKVYSMPVDSATGQLDSLVYDADLVSAIKLFQLRHGLEPDGIIGEKTLKFLAQSFHEKANILALNMERLRWIPNDKYTGNYIAVNIPEYTLRAFENGKEALDMRVIVGAVNKSTPVFSDELNYIVFSPTWTVPTSIIREEIIPRLQKDSAYYAKKNYAFFKDEVTIDPSSESWKGETVNPYKYRIVQQPGPDNSLGLVKFGMPNTMNIYLHDTPNHRLFTKSYRALSHGCVRLDEPARFAEYLLRDQRGWNRETIVKAMNAGTTTTIHLRKRYPVYMEYRTAWVDDTGVVNFREDIYGHDKRQLEQLFPSDKVSTVAGL
ncbi:MAG TPA: L,D-transpeptidase family protein [Ohtaekwangia sp.]|uniref:L,D-transpeptidase family protein n=1 Tax=Ohtaekwangia sp. TaxID=2066019 RepID=UPI002F93F8F3